MNYKVLFAFILFPAFQLLAQFSPEPIHNDVYKFIYKLSQKGIVEFNDQIKPLSRKYIAGKLIEASDKSLQLSAAEREDLEFYRKDYFGEIEFIREPNKPEERATAEMTVAAKDRGERYRLFSYSDDLFKVYASPILGYEIMSGGDKPYRHSWSGLRLYGYAGNRIGFSFDYRDNSEIGENLDISKNLSPSTGGIIALLRNNEIQYSEIHAALSADWSWGDITIGKDFMEWGYGESGKLVLSQKAPSFPFIRLNVNPAAWLHFNYVHGWLNSDVIDSSASYSTYLSNNNREIYRNKFLASHTLSITPFAGLSFSLGESIVYSDRLEIAYLMPLMFFRLADHYLSQGSNGAGANSQFFASVSSRNHIKNTHLYATGFIDEITLSGVFNPEKQRTQIAFSLGASVADLPLDNLTTTLEYTKIYPFVYKHYIPTQTYASSGYQLGHWMGDNADLIYASLNYRFIRGLQATVWAEYIRKGFYDFNQGIEAQYKVPQPPFLWGQRNNYTYAGAEIKYEITHELFARARYQYSSKETEHEAGSLKRNMSDEFYFALYYGL